MATEPSALRRKRDVVLAKSRRFAPRTSPPRSVEPPSPATPESSSAAATTTAATLEAASAPPARAPEVNYRKMAARRRLLNRHSDKSGSASRSRTDRTKSDCVDTSSPRDDVPVDEANLDKQMSRGVSAPQPEPELLVPSVSSDRNSAPSVDEEQGRPRNEGGVSPKRSEPPSKNNLNQRVYELADVSAVSSAPWLADQDMSHSVTSSSGRSMEDPGEDLPEIPMRHRRSQENEEKKEKDILEDGLFSNGHPMDPPKIGSVRVDPLGWPRMQGSSDDDEAVDNPVRAVEYVSGDDDDDDDDGRNLLGGSGGSCSGALGSSSKEERIQQYTAFKVDDESSYEKISQGKRSSEAEKDLQEAYEPQPGGAEDERLKGLDSTAVGTMGFENITVSENTVPTLNVTTVSAQKSTEEPLIDPQTSQQQQEKLEKTPSSGRPPKGVSKSPTPPPPPPGTKRKKKKKRRNRISSSVSRSMSASSGEIPFNMSNSTSTSWDTRDVADANSRSWETKDDVTDNVSATKATTGGSLLEMEPSPGRSFAPVGPQDETLMTKSSSTEMDVTPERKADPESSPKKTLKSSAKDLSRSPASSSLIIQDMKMAEKVEWAISAASSKFEEQVSQSSSKDRSGTVSNDLSCGVFQSWSLPENSIPEQIIATDSPMRDVAMKALYSHQKGKSSSQGTRRRKDAPFGRRSIFPPDKPSPFETAVSEAPRLIARILDFLGDPVAVCRAGMLNKDCHKYVDKNEYTLMRDAVRVGGISRNVRPYFWIWVTLERCSNSELDTSFDSELSSMTQDEFCQLERLGKAGKWNNVIERDVSRSFGNLPPHKTGARLRTDSIVRALVSWGRCRIMKRGVKGDGEAPPNGQNPSFDSDDISLTPTDTVSEWGGVDPVGSVTSTEFEETDLPKRRTADSARTQDGELALSGNSLADDVKHSLQEKLSFILHALAASHDDVGYCQGMDYVVAHLLRILPETIRWQAIKGTLPHVVQSARSAGRDPPKTAGAFAKRYAEVDRSLIVEETCYRVMETFFTTYSLRHFYYPELRCLKTCCRVFEKLIQLKLPVLADHFEHHELNVGLFALGWFQTLFLYLPSMPSATVCHMWDIWLVERSYKIFFRVGTAILFLSQPILLNHELEGMMSYLNTFPDATLLSPDILIPCALQIKVTNKILMELEREVAKSML